MKEIGGYFQLEEMPGEEYYPDLYRVNLGRTALLWLLKSRRCRKILLPYFLCGSVVHTCQENQIETEFYHLNEKLEVLYPKEQLPEGEYLYLVNYYGQLSDSRISEYKKIYGNIIVDHTHAFFQKPLKGIDTLYSCRKFWGVSDGAYLSTDASLTENKTVDYSAERMKHILGRYEHNAGTYYKDMLENAAKYDGMELRQMSKLKDYIQLHLNILLFSLTSVFSKAASVQYNKHGLSSPLLYLFLFLMVANCGIYAITWQQVIKKFSLSTAYANKSVYLLWSQIWAVLIFHENLSIQNIIGILVVLFGVWTVQRYE